MSTEQQSANSITMNKQIDALISQFQPVEIPADTNFWLVRTKGGRFYNDFYLHNFIALGWNLIDEAFLVACPEHEKVDERIKEQVELSYPRTKNVGYPINQSRTFISEMKPGDFIIIPAFDDKPVVFGRLIQYYEDNTKEVSDEQSFLKDLPPLGEDIDCPYKKRWKVEWVGSRQPEQLNPYLNKLFASSHGLTKANNYSDYILPAIFDFYEWNGKYHGVFRVERRTSIHSRELSGFIYYLDLLCENITGSRTFVKSNLNSPGDIIVSIGQQIESLIDYQSYYWILFFISSDVSIGPFTIKGVMPYIYTKLKSKFGKNTELEKADIKLKEAQARKINAEAEAIEIENKRKQMIHQTVENINACSQHLQIKANSTLTDAIKKRTNVGEQTPE